MDKNYIGTKIAELRKSKNLSQSELAKMLCVSNKTISKWECGNGMPDIDTLSKISKIFGVTLDDFVSDDNKLKENIQEENYSKPQKSNINKKSLTTIITSVVIFFVLGISLLCYLFIPRTPIIVNSELFEINQSASTLNCAVNNDKSVLSLNNAFGVPRTNKWKLYYDLNGTREISSKTVYLQIGDNTFYLIVENSANNKKVYTLTIRRKPMYVVSFNANGGESIINQIIMEGELANLVTPKRDGYIFNSWDYDFTKPITKDTIITASWIAKNLKINYNANNGSNESLVQNITYDTEVYLKDNNAFTKKGYTLSSWNTKSDGTGINYSVSRFFDKYNIPNDLDLYAQWAINQYEIKCEKSLNNAGSVDGTGSFDYLTQHTLTANTNEGYTWIGWFDKNNDLITTSTTLTITLDDGNYECIAKWSANNYFCNLDINGGNALTENSKTLIFGESFTLPIPTRTEASFVGWFINDIQYTDKFGVSIINWNIPNTSTLYAKWNVNKYLVTLNTNIQNGGNVVGSGLKEYASSVSITANTNVGYSFVGWYNGNVLLTRDETYCFTMSNLPLTYTAKWQANSYTLTLNENNGNAIIPNTQIVMFDSSYKLPTTTKAGYDFDGWYLGENGTGTKITDKTGNCLSVWSIANDTTLYAKWIVTVYTINYTLSDGNIVGTNPTTYTIEDLDIIINNPTKSGYNFTGWVGTDIEDKTMNLTIPAGSIGNRTYGATYEEDSSFVAISNATDFLAINNNLAGNYYLTNDIDLDGIEFSGFGIENNQFTGTFDGNGYLIKNWGMAKSSNVKDYYGIFKYSSGTIKNVGVANYNLTVRGGGSYVGVLVGYNAGKVYNCNSFGSVGKLNGNFSALVYENLGIVRNCYSLGVFEQSEASIGAGLIAINYGKLINSYSLCSFNIESYGSMYVGGICAKNLEGKIYNCYSMGNLTVRAKVSYSYQDAYVGGLCGYNTGDVINSYKGSDQVISCVVSSAIVEFGVECNVGGTIEKEQAYDLKMLKWSQFDSNYNLWLNENSVWVIYENDYPKLYWEK